MLWIAGLAVGVVYAGIVVFMYVYQGKLMYPGSGPTESPQAAGLSGVSEVSVDADDGQKLLAWWQPPQAGRPVVLYFHGNAGTLAGRADKFTHFGAGGYGLLMPAYRGYSGNGGTPSQPQIIRDAEAAARWLDVKAPGASLILYGESLGGSVALHLSLTRKPAAIVLEGAFDSAADMAQARYPILPAAMLIKDRWDSVGIAPRVAVPVLLLHGGHDKTVPLSHGKRLFEALPEPKRFVVIPDAGHVDLFDFGGAQQVMDWLASQGL
jgi:uncharacterized protein